MKRNIALSLLGLVVLGFLLGGSVLAYFSDNSSPAETKFILGTVEIGESEPIGATEIANEGGKVKWQIKNTGSKAAYLRVSLQDKWLGESSGDLNYKDESAWGEGSSIDPEKNWSMYFDYNFGDAGKSVRLMAGQHDPVGFVRTWTENGQLKVKYEMTTGYASKIEEYHLWVGQNIGTIPNGNGQFPYKGKDVGNEVEITIDPNYYDTSKPILIAAHAKVIYPLGSGGGGSNNLEPPEIEKIVCDDRWVLGEDDYWYYSEPVSAGEIIEFCIEIKMVDPTWEGKGTYSFYLEAEAVQASHNAIDLAWPGHPLVVEHN